MSACFESAWIALDDLLVFVCEIISQTNRIKSDQVGSSRIKRCSRNRVKHQNEMGCHEALCEERGFSCFIQTLFGTCAHSLSHNKKQNPRLILGGCFPCTQHDVCGTSVMAVLWFFSNKRKGLLYGCPCLVTF